LPATATGHGRPVVFLHGFPLDGRIWSPLTGLLEDACRCIVPDLRGFGRAAYDGTFHRRIEDHANDVVALVEEKAAGEPVDFVALSMGGYVALAVIAMRPRLVHRAVLIDTRADTDPPTMRRQRAQWCAQIRSTGPGPMLDFFDGQLFGEAASRAVRAEVRHIMEGVPRTTLLASLEAMAERPDRRSNLAAMHMPMLLVRGVHDRLVPRSAMVEMAALLPDARLLELEGSGHMPIVEQPKELAEAVRAFLSVEAERPVA